MRKVALSLMLASSLSLGGCFFPPINDLAVQADAKAICGWVPLASDIAAVVAALTGGGAIVVDASAVAQAICNAVIQKQAAQVARSGRLRVTLPDTVVVNGVVVHRQK